MLSKKITSLLKQNWLKVFSVTFLFLFFGSYANIFAIASPYNPGETLDPTCLPGEVNCTVDLGGGSVWQESGSDIYFDTGKVGIGTDSPTNTITVRGGSLFLEGREVENPEPSLSSVFAEDEMFPLLQNPTLIVDNDYAYIGNETSLFVLDVSNKNNPLPVDYLENVFPNPVSDMAILGSYLFVVDISPTSLYSLDISDPHNISIVDSISDSLLFPSSLDIYGNYIYVTDLSNQLVAIFDASDPTNLSFVNSFSLAPDMPGGVDVSGNVAYVVTANSSNDYYLQSFDVSDAQNTVSLDSVSDSLWNPTGIYISGNYAYVTHAEPPFTQGKISSFNISDPNNMVFADSVQIPGPIAPNSIAIFDNYLVAGDMDSIDSIHLFDISDPNNITEVDIFSSSNTGSIFSVYYSDGYIYFLDLHTNSLNILEVSLGNQYGNSIDSLGGVAIGDYADSSLAPTGGLIVSGKVGIGTDNPEALLDLKLSAPLIYEQDFWENDGMDDSLNDAIFSGSYSGSGMGEALFVSISSEGNPDTFSYGADMNSSCYGDNVSITGEAQYLCDGIYITFENMTGHSLGDEWAYFISPDEKTLSTTSLFSITGAGTNFLKMTPLSTFIGIDTGLDSSGVWDSAFFGYNAGRESSDVFGSYFFGEAAGSDSIGISNSNFFGNSAGSGAIDVQGSNFFGQSAGSNSSAFNSNFFGSRTGEGAINAYDSIFIGTQTGQFAGAAANSIFIGKQAGRSDTVDNTYDTNMSHDNWSILIGYNTNTGGFKNSILLGGSADFNPISNTKANQFMLAPSVTEMRLRGIDYTLPSVQGGASTVLTNDGSGELSWGAVSSSPIAITNTSGLSALGVGSGASPSWSNFFGLNAGLSATSATSSNFFGYSAGDAATNASHSNFFGYRAGYFASTSSNSNFFGYRAGAGTSAPYSNFLGRDAGQEATNASYSNFFGYYSGRDARNATNSIFIGQSAGDQDTVNNTGNVDDFSILIGKSTSTGGFSNSIALGGSATNTSTNQFMIGSATRPINTTVWVGATGTTTLDTSTGLITTSDERLKTNIEDLPSNTLDKLLHIKTVTFNWLNGNNEKANIGFIAQDLEKYFPELVYTGNDDNNYKGVNYANMTPVLVEAIKELNLKVNEMIIEPEPKSFGVIVKNFLEDSSNWLDKIFVKTVVTEGIEMKDSETGGYYCVIISNGEFVKNEGRCGEEVVQVVDGDNNNIVVPENSDEVDSQNQEEDLGLQEDGLTGDSEETDLSLPEEDQDNDTKEEQENLDNVSVESEEALNENIENNTDEDDGENQEIETKDNEEEIPSTE